MPSHHLPLGVGVKVLKYWPVCFAKASLEGAKKVKSHVGVVSNASRKPAVQ